MFTLEIAAHSLSSALAAAKGGADRIELCTALQTGGLTPDAGLLMTVAEQVDIPIHVLIRPRTGHFVYSEQELEVMTRSIHFCRELGIDGIVIGALQANGRINEKQVKTMLDAAGQMHKTFHRAFDLVPDPIAHLELLIDLGINRILTSGQAPTAVEGVNLLLQLHEKAENRLAIQGASGVNSANLDHLIGSTGCTAWHASAKTPIPYSGPTDRIGVTHLGSEPQADTWESDLDEIQRLSAIIQAHNNSS